MFTSLLLGAASKIWEIAISYLAANSLQILFDAADEAVETALERAEAKAKLTQSEVDDRRTAVLRKYFDGWKDFQKQ